MSAFSDDSRPLLDVGDVASVPRMRAAAEPNYRTLAIAWIVGFSIVRFAGIASLPLANGEAYYYSWSRFLNWSYYDHPPLVAWLVRLFTIFGTTTEALRLLPVACAAVFGFLFYELAERLFRPRAAFLALILVSALPVFLASSLIINPEAPLAPIWVGYLLVLERMRERDEAYRPLLAGVLLGFAFLSKYTAVLLVPTTFLYLALSAPSRRWLRRPSFYAGGGVALLLALPVLLWNNARGWPSLRLHLVDRVSVAVPVAGENSINQLVTVASTHGTNPAETIFRVLVGQIMAYSPFLAPLLGIGLIRSLRRAKSDDRDLFLSSFGLPVFLLLLAAMSRLKDSETHWTMVGLIPAAIAAGRFADEGWSSAGRFPKLGAVGAAVTFFLFPIGMLHAHSGALIRFLPADRYDPRADTTNEQVGWDQVRASVGQALSGAPPGTVLASNHYAMCGRLLYEMGDAPNVYCPTAKRSAFDFFGRHDVPASATVLTVTNDIHDEIPAGLEGRSCETVDEVNVERAGRRVAHYVVRSCPPASVDTEKRASRD